jgi:hypothetical protein
MWSKPTIELATDLGSEAKWPEREAGSEVVESADALIAAVGNYLAGRTVSEASEAYRRQYIRIWYGAADGQRCVSAARAIDEFLVARGRQRYPGTPVRTLAASSREVVAAVARYALGLRPNQPLLRRASGPLDPTDKQMTRPEMRAYAKLVASAVC